MGLDMKKEIKISDLWKRGPKEPKAEKAPKPEKPPKVKKQKAEKPPKEPKERRFGKKAPKEKAVVLEAKNGPPVRDIPLMRAFNLLPKEEAAEKKEGRPSPVPQVLIALAGVLVFAAVAAFYLSASSTVTSKTEELDGLRGELASLQVPEQQPGSKGSAADVDGQRAARTAALSTALADRLAWDRILREVALVLPTGVTLAELKAAAPSPGSATGSSTAERTLTLNGSATNQAAVAVLISRLQVIPELRSVELHYATSPDDNGGLLAFEVIATVRQGATA
jgi:Tfp pilus assembly protein PilN